MWSDYVKERNKAFLSLDRAKIERFCKKWGIKVPSDDEAFWRGVHKVIANTTSFPIDVRQKSASWLFEHGSTPEIGGSDDGKEKA